MSKLCICFFLYSVVLTDLIIRMMHYFKIDIGHNVSSNSSLVKDFVHFSELPYLFIFLLQKCLQEPWMAPVITFDVRQMGIKVKFSKIFAICVSTVFTVHNISMCREIERDRD